MVFHSRQKSVLLLGQDMVTEKEVTLPHSALSKHCFALGSTGSGKTVLGKTLIEENTRQGIPSIVIDPQGDLASLILREHREVVEEKGLEEVADDYHSKVEVRIFTPVTSRGIPICIDPFKPVDKSIPAEELTLAIDVVATSLAQLAYINPESERGRPAKILMAIVLEKAHRDGIDIVDFYRFAHLIAHPDELGFSDDELARLETIAPARVRKWVAGKVLPLGEGVERLMFNFGAPMNIDMFMTPTKKGRVPVNIIYLNTLRYDRHKQFFVMSVAKEIYDWMLLHPSSKLQLFFYMDEVGPFVPPNPHNPPAKMMITALFKQGRKYGVGCTMATQNPADVDYKVVAQANTLAIGRMMQKQDLEKIKQLVRSTDPAEYSFILKKLPGLEPGEFLLISPDAFKRSVHLRTRWLVTHHKTLNEYEVQQIVPYAQRQFFAGMFPARAESFFPEDVPLPEGLVNIGERAPGNTGEESSMDTGGGSDSETRPRHDTDFDSDDPATLPDPRTRVKVHTHSGNDADDAFPPDEPEFLSDGLENTELDWPANVRVKSTPPERSSEPMPPSDDPDDIPMDMFDLPVREGPEYDEERTVSDDHPEYDERDNHADGDDDPVGSAGEVLSPTPSGTTVRIGDDEDSREDEYRDKDDEEGDREGNREDDREDDGEGDGESAYAGGDTEDAADISPQDAGDEPMLLEEPDEPEVLEDSEVEFQEIEQAPGSDAGAENGSTGSAPGPAGSGTGVAVPAFPEKPLMTGGLSPPEMPALFKSDAPHGARGTGQADVGGDDMTNGNDDHSGSDDEYRRPQASGNEKEPALDTPGLDADPASGARPEDALENGTEEHRGPTDSTGTANDSEVKEKDSGMECGSLLGLSSRSCVWYMWQLADLLAGFWLALTLIMMFTGDLKGSSVYSTGTLIVFILGLFVALPGLQAQMQRTGEDTAVVLHIQKTAIRLVVLLWLMLLYVSVVADWLEADAGWEEHLAFAVLSAYGILYLLQTMVRHFHGKGLFGILKEEHTAIEYVFTEMLTAVTTLMLGLLLYLNLANEPVSPGLQETAVAVFTLGALRLAGGIMAVVRPDPTGGQGEE